ncbi:HWE histidine kinase domain-containing protein [Aureimonas leprariae]|uniref:Blue-light-activated histidine kinase n=1 Tax=Plantimonas leprariae TaxID=2615207 RepID=A0A7V7TWU6_9HYPH|nr:HWE histidine kinase domain-containing protein [Aureimonas leprariae]KAB0680398.1 GAF domain-containing protein [Aureimonas leprariae]
MTAEPTTTDEPVDLSNCDREPIHLLGHVQPFGFLVAVSMDWLIQYVSANVKDYLGVEPDNLPGEPLSAIFPETAIHSIRGRLQVLASHDGSERLFGCDLLGQNRFFDVAVHVSGSSIIIEAEPAETEKAINPGALVKSMIARIQKTADLDQLYRESVRQLRAITGFDRVMLYRFAGSGAGEVIAESLRTGLDPFLGLNYPATDIPRQARALYIRNQTRIIADVNAVPVPILPAADPYGQPIDLSLSLLRSVSPIHIEYLKNMRVSASFSVSIVIDGKLWGLFALHHYQPRHLSMEVRAATELFGQMVSFIVEGRIYKERRSAEEAVRELHDRLIGKIVATTQSMEALADFSDELKQIIGCDGLVVWSKGEAHVSGRAPTADELPGLARFLNRAAASRVYSSSELAAVYPKAADFADRGAGVLAIPISRSPRDYILFFRRELIQTVKWAGNPEAAKEMTTGPNGPRLTPRKSFEAWQETVRGKSRGWTESDLKAAEALRVSILEILLRYNEETERQQGMAAQRQELLIAELNHRVRNILSLMRAIVAQSKPGANSVDNFARIIGGRIQALARAHDQITSDDAAATLLHDIIETEVSAYIAAKASRVHLSGPDIFVEAKAFSTLALVFHEMVTNSAKYGALSDSSGSIDVEWRIDGNDACAIEWRERGGPLVQPPKRRGFGSTIIERSIPHDLQGESKIRYALTGLEAEFLLPPSVFHTDRVARRREPDIVETIQNGPSSAAAAPRSYDGMNALVVEDNMLISLDAEQMLVDLGMQRVFLAASVADARKVLSEEAISFALLDVNLGSETSFPLVANLAERNIPFVFATGYGEQVDLPAENGPVRALKKPFSAEQLQAAVSDILAR